MNQPDNLRQLAFVLASAGILLLNLTTFFMKPVNIVPPSTVKAATGQPAQNVTQPLPRSQPISIEIPEAGISSGLSTVDLQADGSPAAPDGAAIDSAAWLTSSVTPGETGTSVIVGHATTVTSGPSVFYGLGNLTPGQQIVVKRQDGNTALFTVDRVQSYSRTAIPDREVYGQADHPALRLITCGGVWNDATEEYSDNIVVYARLTTASQNQ